MPTPVGPRDLSDIKDYASAMLEAFHSDPADQEESAGMYNTSVSEPLRRVASPRALTNWYSTCLQKLPSSGAAPPISSLAGGD